MVRKVLLWLAGVVVVAAVAVYAAFQLSPWPSVFLIRHAFSGDGEAAAVALARHVPAGIAEMRDIAYVKGDRDARLDVFYPPGVAGTPTRLPAIVWVHGGAWVAGTKNEIANYLKILAGRGYVVVGVDYSLAPGATHPVPVRQVNAALAYLARQAERLHIDQDRIVLAGDSAGAQIAAEVANLVSVPEYAAAIGIEPAIARASLRGVILYCGAYDVSLVNLEGSYGGFLQTVLWSYSGHRNFKDDEHFRMASVARYVTAAFPPAFVSAGNADPLEPQSVALAEALEAAGAPVDTLFFADDHQPPLPHEYQVNLDTAEGQEALARSLRFLDGVLAAP